MIFLAIEHFYLVKIKSKYLSTFLYLYTKGCKYTLKKVTIYGTVCVYLLETGNYLNILLDDTA